MGDHRAVQLINHVSERKFKLDRDAVEKVYGDKRLAGLPLTVFCIAGAARKGKSFMLNFFLDYLIHKEKYPKQPWKLDANTCLNGFIFKEGEDRTTMGIWAWSHVFVIEKDNGEKIGVSLIDSQGTFDSETSFEDCSTIFAMTCLFSSVMCFNVFGELQEDKLDNFVTFIRHGQMINDNLGGSGKLFQDLVFIVRDFNVDKFLESKNGGQEYLDKVLGPNKVSQNQEKRDSINSSYERKHCFVFPHPGPIVARKTTTNIKDIDEMFVQKAKHMIETLLSSKTLRAKQLGPTIMNCQDMPDYLASCVKTFDDNKDFAPQAIQAANRHFLINLEVKRAKITYEKLMDKAFDGCDKGMPEKELKHNDADITENIKAQIKNRIRNSDICGSVLSEFGREHEQILKKYMETNNLRLEKEAEKLRHKEELRQQQQKYDKKLEQEKRERKEETRRLKEKFEEERRERERLSKEIERTREIPPRTCEPRYIGTIGPPLTVHGPKVYMKEKDNDNEKSTKVGVDLVTVKSPGASASVGASAESGVYCGNGKYGVTAGGDFAKARVGTKSTNISANVGLRADTGVSASNGSIGAQVLGTGVQFGREMKFSVLGSSIGFKLW